MTDTLKKLIMAVIMAASGYAEGEAVRMHCPSDTASAMETVRRFAAPGSYPSAVAGDIAMLFEGIPYESAMRTDSAGMLSTR